MPISCGLSKKLGLLNFLRSGSGALWHHRGPLDAQNALVQFVRSQTLEAIDVTTAMNVIEVVTRLVLRHVIGGGQLKCRGSSDHAQPIATTSLGSSSRGETQQSASSDCSSDMLLAGLLEFVNQLVQLPVARCGKVTSTDSADADGKITESQLTDALKMNQAGVKNLSISFPLILNTNYACISRSLY